MIKVSITNDWIRKIETELFSLVPYVRTLSEATGMKFVRGYDTYQSRDETKSLNKLLTPSVL